MNLMMWAFSCFLEALTRKRARAEHRLLVIALEQLLHGWLLSAGQRQALRAIVHKRAESAGLERVLQKIEREVEYAAIKDAALERAVRECLKERSALKGAPRP